VEEAFYSSPPVKLSLATEGILFVLRLAVLRSIYNYLYALLRHQTIHFFVLFLVRPNLDHLLTDLALKTDTELRNTAKREAIFQPHPR
jgi:hypothetical protein